MARVTIKQLQEQIKELEEARTSAQGLAEECIESNCTCIESGPRQYGSGYICTYCLAGRWLMLYGIPPEEEQ